LFKNFLLVLEKVLFVFADSVGIWLWFRPACRCHTSPCL
jgi:hypothetical protein